MAFVLAVCALAAFALFEVAVRGSSRSPGPGATETRQAEALSDGAAQRLEKYLSTPQGRNPLELVRAADEAARSLRLRVSPAATATYGRAVALLGLPATGGAGAPARERWEALRKELLAAPPDARASGAEAMVVEFQTAARRLGEEELAGWATALPAEPEEAARRLETALALGGALARRGDPFLLEAARFAASGPAAARPAYRAWAEGRRLSSLYRAGEARGAYARAARDLAALKSPLALEAEVGEAFLDDLPNALVRLAGLERRLAATPYRRLQAEAGYRRALLLHRDGRVVEARPGLLTAFAAMRNLGETEVAAGYASLLGQSFRRTGDASQARLYDARVVEALPRLVDPFYRYWVLGDLNRPAEWPEMALTFQSEAVSEVRRLANPSLLAEGLADLAGAYHRGGRAAEASATLAEAEREARRLSDPADRDRALADCRRTQISWLADDDPDKLERFEQAMEIYGRSEQTHIQRAALLRERSGVRAATGDSAGAEADLEEAYETASRWGAGLGRDEERALFGEVLAPLLDSLLDLRGSRRAGIDELFELAEASRGQSAPGDVPAARRRPSALHDLQAALPGGTVLIEFAPTARRLLIFEIRRDEAALHEVSGERRGGAATSPWESLRAAIDCVDPDPSVGPLGCREEWAEASEAVFQDAVEPWFRSLRPGERVVLVPGGDLYRVPFAALRTGRGDEVLGDGYPLVWAPSASFYLEARRRAAQLTRAEIPLLLVAAPESDPALGYSNLPAALEEARAIGAGVPGALRLFGREATAASVLALLPRAGVVHFAAHADLEADDPYRSFLVLSPEKAGDAGVLPAGDLAARPLPATRLVVLAACRTAGGLSGYQGMVGAARAFLAAGVPTVVASLGPLDDQTSRRLLPLFHAEYRRNGGDAALALQVAQRAVREAEAEGGGAEGREKGAPEWARVVVVGV